MQTRCLITALNERQVRQVIQLLQKTQKLPRDTRIFLQKVSKHIGQLNTTQALQEDHISRLQFQVKTLEKPKIKKRIEKDPNTRFSNIKQIMKAIQEAKEETERIRAKEPELMAKKAADEASKAGLNALCFEWQAY
ncbi:uncharacterized protein ATNIH1004_001638 [Aspergillus tanneri]|uniref:Uncharacterized protein n=1 Tax=Aspergillus tanneri TaxID=1220188 RepID=A0A5M9N620_9EURO|nr:uncharacterized protein ATNIH1004_001638 [Aspergillus tanneri]KAA8652733.1 hypothetical protein ATNIH1004_001638 [Aspergillus tanneri]